ncbi:MAG: hypothetical protein GTO63_03530 [Anaerolineae bacterium]|nr:hypothetical protein [Anaerolineae bacterium]NIN94079.1 hypothetical protein [Anaerolineae bacterium]NIQ77125.1 hypothetical protein [Anaerolineae bacterium]
MKKRALFVLACMLALAAPSVMWASGVDDPAGFPLYVIIEVTWDGDMGKDGSWTVWGPRWDPEVGTGTILGHCPMGTPGTCLDMSYYEFVFRGKTVHFDEIYVPGVVAYPQIRHVVLQDIDGDGQYTGSLSAECYEFTSREGAFHDRIDYWITFDAQGSVTGFRYLEYEHWNQDPLASCD